ncbi:MAG: ABC transporter permease [Gemmatimonadales bacterium]
MMGGGEDGGRSGVRQALSRLARSPGFTTITVLTLAIGIGANTAIFSVFNGILLRSLPYPEPDRLVGLWHTAPGIDIPLFEQSDGTYLFYGAENRTLDGMGIFGNRSVNLTGGEEPERVDAALVTSTLFSALGIVPEHGRSFVEADNEPGAESVVILSHGLWNRRFGGDLGILDSTVLIDAEAHRVIGIMPEGFSLPVSDSELWTALEIDPAEATTGSYRWFSVGRLKPGETVESAQRDLDRLRRRLPEAYPGDFLTEQMMETAQMEAIVHPIIEDVIGDENLERSLWILLGTVFFVLLIACANVASLFLVRAQSRHREVALRVALGAGRSRLARFFLSESLVLALAGGALGVLLAFAATRTLVLFGPDSIPRLEAIGIDGTVLAFALTISLLAGLLFGSFPLLRYARANMVMALKEGGRGGGTGRERQRARKLLVLSQLAMAFVLVAGAGLMTRSFQKVREVDPGFEAARALTFRVSLPSAEYDSRTAVAGFYGQLIERLEGLPGVDRVGAGTKIPLRESGHSIDVVSIADHPVDPGDLPPVSNTQFVTTGVLETLGVPLLEGRTFDRMDHYSNTRAVIVNRPFAERHWPGESPLGKRVHPSLAEDGPEWFHVVGVVGGVRDYTLPEEPGPIFYYPVTALEELEDLYWPQTMSLVLRADAQPATLTPLVRAQVRELDPNLPITDVLTMEEVLSESTSQLGFAMLLLAVAAAIALLLAAIGIYGVMSYDVTRRTREIGVRMALGAQSGAVSSMVVRQGATMAVIGLAVGLAGAFGLTRLMRALLFGVGPMDPATLGLVVLALFAVALLASYLPARRAAAVDPLVALRAE